MVTAARALDVQEEQLNAAFTLLAHLGRDGTRTPSSAISGYQSAYNARRADVQDTLRAQGITSATLAPLVVDGAWGSNTAYTTAIWLLSAPPPSRTADMPAWWAANGVAIARRRDERLRSIRDARAALTTPPPPTSTPEPAPAPSPPPPPPPPPTSPGPPPPPPPPAPWTSPGPSHTESGGGTAAAGVGVVAVLGLAAAAAFAFRNRGGAMGSHDDPGPDPATRRALERRIASNKAWLKFHAQEKGSSIYEYRVKALRRDELELEAWDRANAAWWGE